MTWSFGVSWQSWHVPRATCYESRAWWVPLIKPLAILIIMENQWRKGNHNMLFQGHKQTPCTFTDCLKEVGNTKMSMSQNEFHAGHFVQKCACAMCVYGFHHFWPIPLWQLLSQMIRRLTTFKVMTCCSFQIQQTKTWHRLIHWFPNVRMNSWNCAIYPYLDVNSTNLSCALGAMDWLPLSCFFSKGWDAKMQIYGRHFGVSSWWGTGVAWEATRNSILLQKSRRLWEATKNTWKIAKQEFHKPRKQLRWSLFSIGCDVCFFEYK